MKDFFKYKFGYININDENIFLTSSGNWSETHGLKEIDAHKQNKIKKMGIYSFLFVAVVALLFLVLNGMVKGRISLLLIVLVPFGLYSAYKYLSTELGLQFRIPLSKISDIEIDVSNVDLLFFNSKGNPNHYLVKGIDAKGLEIMTKLKEEIGRS